MALWIASAGGVEIQGARLPAVADPDAPRLRAAVTDGDLSKVVHMALGRTYDAAFCGLVVESLQNLARHGMASLRDAR